MVSPTKVADIRRRPYDFPGLETALNAIRARADRTDRDGIGLSDEIRLLAGTGLFQACLPISAGGIGLGLGQDSKTTVVALHKLRQLGRANLSVARLFEGHINAVKLIALYGRPNHWTRLFPTIRDGALVGVWGADGKKSLTFYRHPGGTLRLDGEKCFASGLGHLSHAVVTLREGADALPQLAVIDVTDSTRQHRGAWQASGMKATTSGVFDFTGLIVEEDVLFGEPGDYEREPHFEGGIWRYCAAQLGGADAIVTEWRTYLMNHGRTNDPFQLMRLARATALCRAAATMLEDCALKVEAAHSGSPDQVDRAVLGSLLARQFIEETCVEVMMLAEKSLGVAAHLLSNPIERMRRDLSLYIRQSAPDAKLLKAGQILCQLGEDSAW